MSHGRYAEKAMLLEMREHKIAWTTDHWTGPNDETYSTVTPHFITKDWLMESCVLDFKVSMGQTTGEEIYVDIQSVLGKYQGYSTVVLDTIEIMDTTGNMGKLGQYYHANG